MRRIIIQGLLAWLIGLLPLLAAGQTLTRYEYWFDNDFANRVSGSLSGTDRTVSKKVSTEGLSDGIHRINFRARQSDGSYSAITSSVFLKLDKPSNTVLEYWFDDNYDLRESVPISANGEEDSLSLDLRSNTKYPFGFHWLKIRAVVAGAGTTSICTEPVLKLAAGVANKLDYWIDGDISNMRTIEGHNASDGNGYIYVTDLDMQDVTPGYHRLYCRTRSSSGYTSSAVTMTPFIKVTSGIASTLEYWVDNDRSNLRTLAGVQASDGNGYVFSSQLDMRSVDPGYHVLYFRARSENGGTATATLSSGFLKLASGAASRLEYWLDGDRSTTRILTGTQASDGNGYVFVEDLDLGDVTPGHHRLYCRARSGSGGTATAVTMTPIIVKSLYHQDEEHPTATVTKYSITVDNGTPAYYDVANPRPEIVQTHVLDASRLPAGNHTVKATFWNSYNNVVSTEQAFKVIEPETPKITLTAQENGGLVKLRFNSIPNDKRYRILRTDANGVHAWVAYKSSSSYPSNISYIDNPAKGTYTYQAQMVYADQSGASQVVKSNEVTVTVNKAQSEEEAEAQYGTVTGRIVCDKNTPTRGLSVRFSNDDQTVPVQGTLFTRNKMPQGTQATLTVEGDETHDYEPVTLTVGPGTTEVIIHGTWHEEFQPNNQTSDLIIASDMEMTCDAQAVHLTFSVKNRSQDHWWSGKIRVRAIEKKKADNLHLDINEMEYGSHNMFTGSVENVGLEGSETESVTVTLDGLRTARDMDFYLYFESIGSWGGEGYTDELKPITGNSRYNINMNPIVWTIPHGEATQEQWDQLAREEYAYLILGLSSVTPGFDGQVGDLEPIRAKVMALTGKRNAKEAAEVLLNWIGDKSALEAINDPNLSNVTSAIKDILIDLHDAASPPLVERYWSNLVGSLSDAVPAKQMIDVFSDIITAVTSDDQFEQTMACSSLLLQAFAEGGDPLPIVSVMHTYSVVGKAFIDVIKQYAQIVSGYYISHRLKHNYVYGEGSAARMNTAVDFKIIVKEAHWYGDKKIDFTPEYVHKQIKSVCVKVAKLISTDSYGHVELGPLATFSFTAEPFEDCIMLKTDGNGVTDGSIEDFSQIGKFYIEIHWKNGRVSYIPLNQSTDGVDISLKDVQNVNDDFSDTKPFVYTVTLTTETGKENMADELYLGKNKKRE